jgi:ABC-2 type transport system permease protein
MLASIYTLSLQRRIRSTLLLSVALTAVSFMYLGLYPSFADQMEAYMEAVPEAVLAFLGGGSLATPAGYLGSTVLGVFGPLIVVGAASTWSAAAIGGEEGDHTLALLLSAPVSRRRVALHKLAAILTALTVLLIVLAAALWAVTASFDIDLTLGAIGAGVLHLYALGLFAAGVTFGVGAATGRRTMALAVGVGIVVAGFVFAGAAGPIEGLQDALWLSPYHWYNGGAPVEHGPAWGSLALLVGVGAAAAATGIARFERRDVAV